MSGQRTAIIIGAGVVGLATCYSLARRGWHVTLVDEEAGPGMGASYANGAQLSYCYTDALASPALLKGIARTLLSGQGIRLSPHVNYAFASWLAQFLRNCTAGRFERNTLANLALAFESRNAMKELSRQHPMEFGQRVADKLHLYFTQAEYENARVIRLLKAKSGCEQLEYSADDVANAESALRGISDALAGAIFTPSEEVGDAHKFCKALLRVLEGFYAFQAVFGSTVSAIGGTDQSAEVSLQDGSELSADVAIVCAGPAAPALLKPLGIALPIIPMKGYSFEMPVTTGSPSISLTDTKRKIVFSNLGDRMRVAGFADLGNSDRLVDPAVSARLVASAREVLPKAGDYDKATNHWAGLRPMTPDSMPIISRPRKALAINAGHGMLGWTTAMGSAERLAQLLDNVAA